MKYKIGSNVNVKIASVNDMEVIFNFQDEVLKAMINREFFVPLNYNEVLDAINNGKIYLLYFECELIGLCVLNCKPKYDIISEYKLSDNENVGILDSVMIKREFRGSKLQKQIIEYIDKDIVDYGLKSVVATVHPDNVWSLNNLLDSNYEIINKLIVHGGERYILCKKY